MSPHDPDTNESSSLLEQGAGGAGHHLIQADSRSVSSRNSSGKGTGTGRARRHSSSSDQRPLPSSSPFSLQDGLKLVAVALVLVAAGVGGGMLWKKYRPDHVSLEQPEGTVPHSHAYNDHTSPTNSKYQQVQYFGFQIYTGGAPAFLEHTSQDNITTHVPNPECHGLPYGEVILDVDPVLMCYVGDKDPLVDVQRRLQIMKDAVEKAYTQASKDPGTLKIFVAPEFYWRGLLGSYQHGSLDTIFSNKCKNGPVCNILRGLEALVEDARFQDWFFLFGTVIASQTLPAEDRYDYLFYNFAPVYKGFDPQTVQDVNKPLGKRFLLPKRYVSDSDFLAKPKVDGAVRRGWKELLGAENQPNTTDNPFYIPRHRYNDNLYEDYKTALGEEAGYAMIEYDWIIVDGITMTVEICFDHQKKTALNTYLGDIIKGKATRIPRSSDDGSGLEYVPIPNHQGQIGLVSSAGMTINADSMALVQHGILFLQDGLNNQTCYQYHDIDMYNTCDQGTQFAGGTEAVSRRAIVSKSDVNFLYQVHDPIQKMKVYDDEDNKDWVQVLHSVFSTAVYEPTLVVHEPLPIAPVNHLV